ncbi:MAG: hypothetical protein JWM95_1741 [Gemmatimonadetes bacterium]|nr:hypothetical protein [Gemmatimonadota bacterium]
MNLEESFCPAPLPAPREKKAPKPLPPPTARIPRVSKKKATELLASGPPPRTPVKKRNAERRSREFERTYGSVARVEWMKAQPCEAYGTIPTEERPSQNAHVGDEGKAARMKANYDQIVPLSAEAHRRFDRWLNPFDELALREALIARCALVQARWLAECARRGIEP